MPVAIQHKDWAMLEFLLSGYCISMPDYPHDNPPLAIPSNCSADSYIDGLRYYLEDEKRHGIAKQFVEQLSANFRLATVTFDEAQLRALISMLTNEKNTRIDSQQLVADLRRTLASTVPMATTESALAASISNVLGTAQRQHPEMPGDIEMQRVGLPENKK